MSFGARLEHGACGPARRLGASRRLLVLALLTAPLLSAAFANSALAGFGPIELQSVGSLDQFESAGEPAISADGRYLAFQGSLDGVIGVFRKDLQTGAVELVAGGSAYSPGPEEPTDAFAPSISADGQYVSFNSSKPLVGHAHVGSNVYVRNMALPLPAAGACSALEEAEEAGRCPYELASVLDGGDEGITAVNGVVASGRVALSANGREVVFVTEGESDLQSHDPQQLSTPPLQVVVRYLDTDTTTLVSQTMSSLGSPTPEPVLGGAVTPTTEQGTEVRRKLPGAALSGDGSTVAWLGAHIPAQAPTLSDERARIEGDDTTQEPYDEPLWRRIGDGPSAPTRRMVGGGDPLAPGCHPGGTLATPACQGPFPQLLSDQRGGNLSNNGWLGIEGYDGVPQLSADGWTVALIGDPRAADPPAGDQGGTSNVFMVNMHEGLDRVQALRQLTREVPVLNQANPGSSPAYVASAGDIYDIGISPDARRIAFTTQRQLFPLAPPNFTEAPLAQLGLQELYQIDLNQESLERVTHGPGDGPSLTLKAPGGTVTTSGASAPSYSEDDRTLAFADSASNLVAGDANEASDVFTVARTETSVSAGLVEHGAVPATLAPIPVRWALSVVPVLHANGSVTLDVLVPGVGELYASAAASVPVTIRAHSPSKTKSRAKRTALESRTIAAAKMPSTLPGLLELPLSVSVTYASLLRSSAGIYAKVRVTFKGGGGSTLTQTVAVSLRNTARKAAKRKKSASPKHKHTAKGRS